MVLQGGDMMCWISDNESGTPKSIGGATSHTLTINQSLTSISCKDFGSGRFSQQAPGLLDWSVSSDHYIIDSDNNQGDGVSDSQFSTLDDSRYGLGYADMMNYMLKRKPIFVTVGMEGTSKDYNENKAPHPEDSTNGWSVNKTKYPYWSGYAYITNLTKNMPNGDLASYSIELTGTGELKPYNAEATTTYSVQNPVQVATATAKKVATEKA